MRLKYPLLIIAVGVCVYANGLSGPFTFDDHAAIEGNEHIRRLWPIRAALVTPRETTVAGRPVVNLSLAVNYAIGGLDVRGYHVFNIAIHIAAALTLFGIVRRTLILVDSWREKFDARSTDATAFAVAVLWVVHPLQTAAVTYVVQRAESLMGLFFLLTLYAFIRGSQATSRGASILWFAVSVGCSALGMGCKEVMVVAPIIVLLVDRTFLARSTGEVIRRRWAMHLTLAATWIILAALVTGGARPESAGFKVSNLVWTDYAKTQLAVVVRYLRLAFWPSPLVFDYYLAPAPGVSVPIVSTVIIALLVIAALVALRFSPAWGFLGAWFFLILAPTSSVLPIADAMFEHRMYLPLAAVVAAVVVGVRCLAARVQGSRVILGMLFLTTATTLSIATIVRNHDYRSEIAIWSDTVEKRPTSPRAHYNLGQTFSRSDQRDRAIAEYFRTLELEPNYYEAHYKLGASFAAKGDLDAAIDHFREAIRLHQNFPEAYCQLGLALERKGDLPAAIAHLRQAVALRPSFGEAVQQLDRLEHLVRRPP